MPTAVNFKGETVSVSSSFKAMAGSLERHNATPKGGVCPAPTILEIRVSPDAVVALVGVVLPAPLRAGLSRHSYLM